MIAVFSRKRAKFTILGLKIMINLNTLMQLVCLFVCIIIIIKK